MSKEKFKLIAAVYLVLIQDGKVLLSRRFNTGYEDGNYSLPAGHLERGESLRQGLIREVREEIATILELEDINLEHVMHRKKKDHERLDFFFTTNHFAGEPKNAEPEKCDELSWFPLDTLPENTVPYVRQAIDCIRRRQSFSEFGW
jgi:ADP-ribose pyrophosphatase YjhB (NUDIX family)